MRTSKLRDRRELSQIDSGVGEALLPGEPRVLDVDERERAANYDWLARVLLIAGVVLEVLFHHSWLLVIGICLVIAACSVLIAGRTREKRRSSSAGPS